MPNIAVSQADATAHFDRWLMPDRKAQFLRDAFKLFSSSAILMRHDGGYTAAGARMIASLTLVGVVLAEALRNTDADGRLWVRVTANAGNWDVLFYKAKTAQAGDKVAEAINVAASATGSVVQGNSSGITGSITLGASIAAIANDTYSIQCWPGFNAQDRGVFDQKQLEDGEMLDASLDFNASVAASLSDMITAAAALTESDPWNRLTGRIWKIPRSLNFLNKEVRNNNDAIEVTVDGIMERLRQNWKDNTTEQKVSPTTLAASAVTYESTNLGVGVLTVGAIGENFEPGLVQLTCAEDDNPSAPRFTVTFTPDDGTGDLIGQQKLTLFKVWDDPEIPIQLSLVPTFAKSGDGGNVNLAVVADLSSISGMTAANSDDGVLYWKVRQSGAAFIFEFYSDSSRTKKVAQSPAVAAATVFTATPQNFSGLSISWKSGSAPVDLAVGSVDIQPFKKGSSGTPPDQMRFSVTRSAKGRIQEAMRENHAWKLWGEAGPTFADTFIDKGGAFFDVTQ